MTQSIVIFTGKNIEWMKKEGGSGFWIAQGERIKQAEYLLCVRNHRETWAIKDDGIGHGQAFLIAKIDGYKESNEHKGRKIITFKEYAELPKDSATFKKAWKSLTDGQRYPVAYIEPTVIFEKMKIDVNQLNWQKFETLIGVQEENRTKQEEAKDLSQVILEAKKIIARVAGVELQKVNIQVEF